MTYALVKTRAAIGIEAPLVHLEVHLSPGLPGFSIVGLPEKGVKESKDRVRSAIINSGFRFPAKKIIVNLAPADLPKEGGRFDLPMAIGILLASKQLFCDTIAEVEMAGELALTGTLRPIKGMLPLAIAAQAAKHQLIYCAAHADTIGLVEELVAYPAETLQGVCDHLSERQPLSPTRNKAPSLSVMTYRDLSSVKGQPLAKRALLIAACGSHSLLLSGSPGAGKTLLASCLPGILPPLSNAEALSVASIQSIAGKQVGAGAWGERPFRAPHHSASCAALVGGGNPPQPGEISLAHQGVLFLDELPEFQRPALEALREPLESGQITLSRSGIQLTYPAEFQFVAAMNPCPCGYVTEQDGRCRCTHEQIQRYQSKLSGPILDRIDLCLTIKAVPIQALESSPSLSLESPDILKKIMAARQVQYARQGMLNSRLSSDTVPHHLAWSDQDKAYFNRTIEQLKLSARAYYRMLKLARSIADLAEAAAVARVHLEEALFYAVEGKTILGAY